jgi:hypothetical protein
MFIKFTDSEGPLYLKLERIISITPEYDDDGKALSDSGCCEVIIEQAGDTQTYGLKISPEEAYRQLEEQVKAARPISQLPHSSIDLD